MILESTLEIPHIVPQNEKKILRVNKLFYFNFFFFTSVR
jgi:hypothetical protein